MEIVVTPYVGVWIEIFKKRHFEDFKFVTPYVGVWIEISVRISTYSSLTSHSLRGSVD